MDPAMIILEFSPNIWYTIKKCFHKRTLHTMKTKRKIKKSQKIIGVLIIVIAILIFVVGGIYILFDQYYSSSDYVEDDKVTIDQGVLDQLQQETLGELENLDQILTPAPPITEELAKGTYNLLLIGVDIRDVQWHGNSDSMILITVNHDVKKVFMTSFMRDLYANIEGYGVYKLNAAHAIGGGPLLVQTIKSNYGVAIDNYARVDFSSLTRIIDIVGGVDIDVSADEAAVANNYIKEMCKLQGKDYEANEIMGSGMMRLSGIQAVAYCRIRYVGHSDFERTSRQREVLTALINKAKSLGLSELNTLVNEVLPLVTHNVEQKTVLSLISQLPSLLSYEFVSNRVPYDGLYTIQNEILIPNMAETVKRLQETLYAKE